MVHDRKQERLPGGMALVQTADGRWFPAFATLSVRSHHAYVLEESEALIPPALPPYHDPAQGYALREEAVEACRAWLEAMELFEEWQALAARTEVYPERTSWYLHEIKHLAGGDDTAHLYCGISAHAVILARQTVGESSTHHIAVIADTPDEAFEVLYKRVYEWARTFQVAAPFTDPH